ncbi:MAG: type II 3-dehydroquinate dehydratase [Candidatus Nanopelagicaceae bacterium]|jgi:3-dehydroquinate dehydratase-2
MKILVLNGPNISRLDIRDSKHYGNLNWSQLQSFIVDAAKDLALEVEIRQSDDEATIVSWLHEAADNLYPVIINPAAFTHYSVAIHDAVEMVKSPVIEVHLSNPMSREEFRHTSVISGVAVGTIAGFGPDSYRLALLAMKNLIPR